MLRVGGVIARVIERVLKGILAVGGGSGWVEGPGGFGLVERVAIVVRLGGDYGSIAV